MPRRVTAAATLQRLVGLRERLAADNQQRPARGRQRVDRRLHAGGRRSRRGDLAHRGRRRVVAAGEHARGVPVQVEAQQWVGERPALAGSLGVPLPDARLAVAGRSVRGEEGAASILGIKPTTLEARMARLGLHRPKRASSNPS